MVQMMVLLHQYYFDTFNNIYSLYFMLHIYIVYICLYLHVERPQIFHLN